MSKTSIRRYGIVGFIGAAALALSACGGTPTKDDVKDMMMDGADQASSLGVDEATWEKFADCFADKATSTMSDEGLETMADAGINDVSSSGNVDGLSADDQKAFTDALTSCSSVMVPSK